jgi:hypothetical protein
MSRILEAALDVERREDCTLNDRRLVTGEPIRVRPTHPEVQSNLTAGPRTVPDGTVRWASSPSYRWASRRLIR